MSNSGIIDGEVEELGAGISLERLYNGKLLVFTLLDAHHETLDMMTTTIIDTMQHWSLDQPLLTAYDLSSFAFLSISPYARQKGDEMKAATPKDLHGRTAIIIHKAAIAAVFNLFLKRSSGRYFDYQIFHRREDAIEWLGELL